MEIFIKPDGSVKHISVDGFSTAFLGKPIQLRASFIEPVNPVLRVLFHVIRNRVSDISVMASWTRRWNCHWQVNLYKSGGPILGPFTNRKDAVAAEIAWLNKQYESGAM